MNYLGRFTDRDNYTINTVLPAIQTGASLLINEVVGALGHHKVSIQNLAVISAIASVVAEIASNMFDKAWAYYAALPVGIGAGVAIYQLFNPSIALPAVLAPEAAFALFAVLAAVKLANDKLASKADDEDDAAPAAPKKLPKPAADDDKKAEEKDKKKASSSSSEEPKKS